jgi:outer membrane protein assembly factor BamB
MRAMNPVARRLVFAVRRRWTGVGYAVTGAVVMLLLLVGSRFIAGWRSGRVELSTQGESVVVQVLDEASEEPLGEPVGLVDRAVIALPAGEYKLRVDGKGRLGRTFRFSVNRGETLAYSISIDEGRLLGGELAPAENNEKRPFPIRIPAPTATAALELDPGKADFFGCTQKTLIRRDGATGKVIWEVESPHTLAASASVRERALWRAMQANVPRTRFVETAPDLNGDGTGDLLLGLRPDAGFVAFSGKNGAMLWKYFAGPHGRPGSPPSESAVASDLLKKNAIAGEPALADVNRDGTQDLIATLDVSISIGEQQRVVVAVSGRSGDLLWSYPVDDAPRRASATVVERPAVLVQGRESKLVAYVDGSEWIGLDPETGKRRAGPVDLGLKPVVPVRHADLDGDGEPEILAFGPEPGGKERMLRAFSVKNGRELWAESVDAAFDQLLKADSSRGLPALVDVDGDGRPEILARDAGPMPRLKGYRGVKLIEGATGATRWRVAMSPAKADVNDRVAEVIAAPDLDGDGASELVFVSAFRAEQPAAIYVDAISGRDGRRLWSWSVATDGQAMPIGRPVWWGHGPDGWPFLALPLGGEAPDEKSGLLWDTPLAQPTVHLLEASTGRERHRVVGLERPGFADLDGDGLSDLWGEVDGELRAFRGEGPEAWRALGRFDRAGWPRDKLPAFLEKLGVPRRLGFDETRVDPARPGGLDFDGDGVGDLLSGDLQAPGKATHEQAGSHTAVARSGRDGRVIWKTQIDPRTSWLNPASGESYELHAPPLPDGDLDGDGTADVIVNKAMGFGRLTTGRGASLDVELLSGRTGTRIWSGGRLPENPIARRILGIGWTDACVVEPNGRPDVIVGQFTLLGSGRSSLTRISGRDGRVLWEVDLREQGSRVGRFPHFFGDLNGDGGMDALVVIPADSLEHSLVAISLRDGKLLWSETLKLGLSQSGKVRVGDLDGDGRDEVIVAGSSPDRKLAPAGVRVLDGRDGKVRWTWALEELSLTVVEANEVVLANVDGNATRSVCVSLGDLDDTREIIILDASGKQRARRGLGGGANPPSHDARMDRLGKLLSRMRSLGSDAFKQQTATLTAADLDGDGRDELLLYQGDKFHAWDRDLKELWFWPARFRKLDQVIPTTRARPGMVIVPPGVFLDAAKGQPRWMGQAPVGDSTEQLTPKMLDPGDSERPPLLIAHGPGATVCRVAMATQPDGSVAPPRGTKAVRRLYRNDARWARPLPWVNKMVGALGPNGFLVSGCLALVNVFVPLLILRLVTRRRRSFNMWALLVLPVAAAVPLMAYQTVLPWLSTGENRLLSTETRVFLTGTMAGIPVVYFLVVLGGMVMRRRWKLVLVLLGLTLMATLLVAGLWVWVDRRSMAVNMEHYVWEGWERVVMVGAYGAAVLWGVGRVVLLGYKLVRRRTSVVDR